MYLPPQFSAKDRVHAAHVVREHPFASLISVDEEGARFVTHLPLHLEERGGDLSGAACVHIRPGVSRSGPCTHLELCGWSVDGPFGHVCTGDKAMRMIFGVLGLLLVVAITGMLAKKQLSSANDIRLPAVPGSAQETTTSIKTEGMVQQQSQQIQQQFKAAAEAAVQQARPMPDDK